MHLYIVVLFCNWDIYVFPIFYGLLWVIIIFTNKIVLLTYILFYWCVFLLHQGVCCAIAISERKNKSLLIEISLYQNTVRFNSNISNLSLFATIATRWLIEMLLINIYKYALYFKLIPTKFIPFELQYGNKQ